MVKSVCFGRIFCAATAQKTGLSLQSFGSAKSISALSLALLTNGIHAICQLQVFAKQKPGDKYSRHQPLRGCVARELMVRRRLGASPSMPARLVFRSFTS
jgi:hypothetical protein